MSPEERESKIHDLILECEIIELEYRDHCLQLEEDWGEIEGDLYDNEYGPGGTFEVNAENWHTISLLLRELRKHNE